MDNFQSRAKRAEIDTKIEQLRRMVRFAMSDYDYHHKNDEMQILERMDTNLEEAHRTYSGFLSEQKDFEQYLEELEAKTDKFDAEILEIVDKFNLSKDLIATGRKKETAETVLKPLTEQQSPSGVYGDKENHQPRQLFRGQLGKSSSYEELTEFDE